MNITDDTYYLRGKKFIPTAGKGELVSEGVEPTESELTTAIVKYERLFLFNFLNADLYNQLVLALSDLDNAEAKWVNLVNGTTYEKDGETYIFDGLRGFDKDSMVGFFVFCKYMENNESYYSTIGTVKGNQGSTSNFAQTRKYIDAWSNFLAKYQNTDSNDSIAYIVDDYNTIVGVDYYINKENKSNSLVTLETFLSDNESDYEGYSFNRFEDINSLG